MMDEAMQQAYLSAFQYDDIDDDLPEETDYTPRVGDEGVITWRLPQYTSDGLWQGMDSREQLFRIGVMEASGLPVIECRDNADDTWDEYPPEVFDLLDFTGDVFLTPTSRADTATSPRTH